MKRAAALPPSPSSSFLPPASSTSSSSTTTTNAASPNPLALLPPGTDELVADYLPTHSLYCLACTHPRDLAKSPRFVQGLEELTGHRVQSLLAWLSAAGGAPAAGKTKARQLPRLTHLHFSHRMDWEATSLTRGTPCDLARFLRQSVFPSLANVDFSNTSMSSSTYEAMLHALAASTPSLRALYFPALVPSHPANGKRW